MQALKDYYIYSNITEGSKTLKISPSSGRIPADVVVCAQYRRYKTVSSYDYVEGMCFWSNSRQIINYPKAHYDNGVSKQQNTNDWYKPLVRVFKNARGSVVGVNAPSYFLECMLYNVPSTNYGVSFQASYINVLKWLHDVNMDSFICNNGRQKLFGSELEQWDIAQAKEIVMKLVRLWNNW